MSKVYTLNATLLLQIGSRSEKELDVAISYQVSPGYPETRDEPGCEATAEILSVGLVGADARPDWSGQFFLTREFENDEILLEDCLADWAERQADERSAAEEYRADQIRDDRMMERF